MGRKIKGNHSTPLASLKAKTEAIVKSIFSSKAPTHEQSEHATIRALKLIIILAEQNLL